MRIFSRLSKQLHTVYTCPSCRDDMLPKHRNSFPDFKLKECLNALITLGMQGEKERIIGTKAVGFDFLKFLNSSKYVIDGSESDQIDLLFDESYEL